MPFNPRRSTPHALLVTAARQGGVVSRRQARASTLSRRAQCARIAREHWPIRLGTIVIPEIESDRDLRDAFALTLRIGPDAIVTGPTAARLQGVPITSDAVIAIAPVDHHARAGVGRILRRPPAHETRVQFGVRLTDPREAVLDTLLSVGRSHARALLWTALQQKWVTPEFLAETLARRRARGQHRQRLRRLVALANQGSHSEAESAMATLIRRHKLGGWRANHPLADARGQVIAVLDFALPAHRLAIEVDGRAFHSDRDAFERDRVRQNAITLQGWTVLRFTWEEITQNRERVVRTVRAAVASGKSSGQGVPHAKGARTARYAPSNGAMNRVGGS